MPAPKPPQKDEVIRDADLYLAFRLMKRKEYDGAEHHILEGIKKARREMDETLEGLYHSALGILYKLKKDFKKSYKYYQQAEKLLPDDNSLKLITTLLLIEEFGQYDTAVRKLDKILEAEKADPAMVHHARAAKGLAFLKWGKKDKSRECLETMLKEGFVHLRSATNLDFKLVEAFLKKNLFAEVCKDYLDRALAFARAKREKVFEKALLGIMADLPKLTTKSK